MYVVSSGYLICGEFHMYHLQHDSLVGGFLLRFNNKKLDASRYFVL